MYLLLSQCIFIITSLLPIDPQDDPRFEERVSVCQTLTKEAENQDVPLDLVLAVAWQEARMTDAGTNSSGCSGPMQIKIKYWCPNKKGDWHITKADGALDHCDLYERGVYALNYYLNRFKTTKSALCGYGWGNCTSEGMEKYVNKTLKYRRVINDALNSYWKNKTER